MFYAWGPRVGPIKGVNVGGHTQQPDQWIPWLLGRDAQESSFWHWFSFLPPLFQCSIVISFLSLWPPVFTVCMTTRHCACQCVLIWGCILQSAALFSLSKPIVTVRVVNTFKLSATAVTVPAGLYFSAILCHFLSWASYFSSSRQKAALTVFGHHPV